MFELTNDLQLFYSRDGSIWEAEVTGNPWSEEKCKGYLYKHLTYDEYQLHVAESITLQDVVKQHLDLIDSTSFSILSKWTRFTEEYEIAEAQAKAFKDAGYQGECGVYITSYAEPEGISNQEATDIILAQADSLRTLQIQLREQRMRKRLLLDCATIEEVEALSQEIQDKIKVLGESYE